MSELGGEGTGIVMTDLFISATAALLLCLAVSRPTPVVPLPIQADLVLVCPVLNYAKAPFVMSRASDPNGISVEVGSPEDLAKAPKALELPPSLFRTIAVMATAQRPVSATCLRRLTDDVVRVHNSRLATTPATDGLSRAVFAVAPVLPPKAGTVGTGDGVGLP